MQHKSIFRRRDALIASFLVPVLVLIIVFIVRGIFPFGDQCYLRTDLYHQYAPFFSELRHKLTTGGSLLYSWDVGLGVNFSAIYAYYLASPLNWLILLCPKQFVIEFITVMIVLKSGACGLTMTWYLQKHSSGDHFSAAYFGIFYALSAYMAAYSWNVMWLDCILLFPLIVYGTERLVRDGKCVLYTVTLGICITSNYYISIMICMFLVIYAVARAILDLNRKRDIAAAAGRFTVCSLIAGGISAAVLLPEIFALQSTSSGNFDFPKTWEMYFSILDMLSRHIGNIECEIGLDHWPNIFCGVAVMQLVLLYVVNRKVSLKEKAVYGTILIFFLASFSINVLNYIWHGFHYPNSLPCRQSFIYIFLVLFISYRAIDQAEGNSLRDLKISYLCVMVFILFCQKFVENEDFHFSVYYAAMLFVSFYALFLWIWRTGGNADVLLITAMLLVVGETLANHCVSSVPTTTRSDYLANNEDYIALHESVPQDDFARYERLSRKSKDDGAWLNYPSVSLFSSTAQKSLSDFMRDLGCESSVNAYGITGGTPFVDALLDEKYAFYDEESKNPALTEKGRSGDIILYENPSVFPLGFAVNPDFSDNWALTLENPADVQNDLCSLMDTAPVLVKQEGKTNGKNFTFTAEEDGEYYVFATNGKIEKVKAELPGGKKKTFDNLNRRYFMELGTLQKGSSVTLRNTEDGSNENLEARVYRFDYDALAELKDVLTCNPMIITSFSDTEISARVNADHRCELFTSIPYDEGWTVRVDGAKTDTKKSLDTFLSVPLAAGEHTLEFSYVPKGLKAGIMISGVSLAALLFLILLSALEKKRGTAGLRKNDTGAFPEDADDDPEEDTEDEEDTENDSTGGEKPEEDNEDAVTEDDVILTVPENEDDQEEEN